MSTSPAARSSLPVLPAMLTPLLGRETELDHLQALIDTPSIRLITLTGPGGVGKTRLALHLATTLMHEFDRDLVFVPLASIRDTDLVLPTIGQALGLLADASDAFRERLAAALAERSPLLVLDNFEQILDAAPIVANLLARSPETTILVTSQTALGIPGEQLYPLSPLPIPATNLTTAERILQSDAVALFITRARAVKPHLVIDDPTAVTIAEICRRLDGLPLAIELAAARINILSPDALLARLSNRLQLQLLGSERRGVPDRLRTMRHAIAWSYGLLTADEQALFRQLSIFAGGISLDAVEALYRDTESDRDVYGVLSALVDHSLLQARQLPGGETRFLMLETLRDYGIEQLEIRGEGDDVRLAHATHFLDLAETAEPHLTGQGQGAWLDRLDPEWENIRATLAWSLAKGHEAIALRMMGAIWRFCSIRGHVAESRVWIERALNATVGERTSFRVRALNGAGFLAEDQRDLDSAQRFFQQALELAASIGSLPDEYQARLGLGTVAHDRGDYVAAFAFHAQAVDLARASGDQRGVGIALGNMATVRYFQGRPDDAERYWEEGRLIVNAVGDSLAEAIALSNLGAVVMERGDFARAQHYLDRALALQRELNDSSGIPYTITNLAETWCYLGDHTLSNDLFTEAVSAFRELGFMGSLGTALRGHATLALVEGDLARSASMIVESTALVTEPGDQLGISENAELLAEVCGSHGNHAVAIELIAAASANRRNLGSEQTGPVKKARLDAILETARTTLGARLFDDRWAAGYELDLDTLTRRIGIVAREIIGGKAPVATYAQPPVQPVAHGLTARELEVLGLLAQGRSTREISAVLFISPRTTATHVTNILGKLEVTSRTAAVALAMRSGLV